MKIELLYFEGCPHAAEADARLTRVAARLAPDTPVERLRVESEAEAEAAGFLGSPSIRVDGEDLERTDTAPFFGCRVYEGGAPPEWMIEAALVRALRPRHVLFLCVANSARSQLAEALAQARAPEGVRVSSAGSAPTAVRPETRTVLAEAGLGTAALHAKAIDAVEDPGSVDLVVTLCEDEVCPAWLGEAVRLHWALPDPAAAPAADRLEAFRRTRDVLARRTSLLFPEPAP